MQMDEEDFGVQHEQLSHRSSFNDMALHDCQTCQNWQTV